MKIGVIGAGTMGQGIAKAFAQVEGNTVALCDIKQEWAENGLAKIKKGYEKLVAKGKMTQEKADAIVAAITPGLKEDLCADCDLVVEAAFEDMKVKQTTFGELDKICKPECIFASNTSSLSITEIGKGVGRPLVGMHFFNPADRMKLIEVIAGCNTPAETVEKIKEISVAIGKQPVQVNEAAGFVVNRILIPMINEEAYNAEEALEFLKQYTPSLIITDIMMPNIDGLELISLIKENRYTRHIPLIIVSAKISDQEQAAGLNIGADAYLTKPFSPTVLLSVVNRLMTNQRELKEYFYSPESAYQYTEGQLLHQEDKEFLDAVTAIIKENVSKEGLGPELVADALNINTRILYRRFKKISTMTPSDFIKDYRLNYAAQLLVNTNMSVQEIIYNVGISNKSYFYREFARKYNMTPKEYRTKEA